MKKIFVINNDIDTMSLLKNWLERKNYQVHYSSNSEEILTAVKKFSPDLVLMDVLQTEAGEKLRSDEDTHDVPIILMTGYTYKSDHFIPLPVDDIIEKPFEPAILEKKIRKLLSH